MTGAQRYQGLLIGVTVLGAITGAGLVWFASDPGAIQTLRLAMESGEAISAADLGALEAATERRRSTLMVLAVIVLLLLGVLARIGSSRLIGEPAGKISRSIRSLLESRQSEQPIHEPGNHALGELPATVTALADALGNARRETRKAMETATRRINEQKNWLETTLQALEEGVLVCSRQHQILLYNPAVVNLLGTSEQVGLGRSVFDLLSRAPVRHTLERLERGHADAGDQGRPRTTGFVCSTRDGHRMLHGRMGLIADPSGAVSGYLMTLADISEDVSLLGTGEAVRYALTREFRGLVANLRAAAENLDNFPDMDPADRARFIAVVLAESTALSDRIDALAGQLRGQLMGRWPMADVLVTDLINCLDLDSTRELDHEEGPTVEVVGIPLWIHADTLSLVQALECVLRQLIAATGVRRFEVEATEQEERVDLDISWQGAPVSAGQIEHWLNAVCDPDETRQRLGTILERHGCEMWSQAGSTPGTALLRLPLPAPRRSQFVETAESIPARPEFYDFGLLREHQGGSELADVPIDALSFVVFDCEMTGLNPKGGDEIIAIAGIRVVQGRVLQGERFERLVNPGFPIPRDSIRFHGITDDQVADKPTILDVLPRFREFVGDAVLVAHNAAFDMTFLELKEPASGVRFDNPVIDTLLISAMLDGDEEEHSLDAICDRYRITIPGRHTAMGDTLATAEVLVRLIERMQARGIHRFGDLLRATNMAAQLRHRARIVQS